MLLLVRYTRSAGRRVVAMPVRENGSWARPTQLSCQVSPLAVNAHKYLSVFTFLNPSHRSLLSTGSSSDYGTRDRRPFEVALTEVPAKTRVRWVRCEVSARLTTSTFTPSKYLGVIHPRTTVVRGTRKNAIEAAF